MGANIKTANEVDFVRHCDDPDCGLGQAEYVCPVCGEHSYSTGDS